MAVSRCCVPWRSSRPFDKGPMGMKQMLARFKLRPKGDIVSGADPSGYPGVGSVFVHGTADQIHFAAASGR